jgi:hypothetical protein
MTEAYDNDEMLDRLVDGELSSAERQQMLTALEARPDGWRRCALAFLEAQSWGGEMRRLVSDAADRDRDQPVVTLASAESSGSPRRSSAGAGAWMSVAAAVLVAFGLGRQMNSPRSTLAPQNDLAVAPLPLAPEAGRAEPDADAVTLVLDDSRGTRHRVQMPLVEGRQLGEEFADAPQWSSSPELHRRLDEQGLGLRAMRRYVPLQFEQQNKVIPMIVPVDDAVVTPVRRRVL